MSVKAEYRVRVVASTRRYWLVERNLRWTVVERVGDGLCRCAMPRGRAEEGERSVAKLDHAGIGAVGRWVSRGYARRVYSELTAARAAKEA